MGLGGLEEAAELSVLNVNYININYINKRLRKFRINIAVKLKNHSIGLT